MIRIAISAEAYKAIEATMPVGTVAVEPERDENGQYLVWLERRWVTELDRNRRPGESWSDVIMRLAR